MTRALHLYALAGREAWHRLRHDLAQELVVFVASLILFATFLYVFNDFLNVQVSSLSTAMRDRFAEVLTIVVLGGGTLATAGALRRARLAEQSLTRLAAVLGETAGVIRQFTVLRSLTTVAVVHGLTWLLVTRTLMVPSPAATLLTGAVMIGVSLGLAYGVPAPKRLEGAAHTDAYPPALTPTATLTRWRLRQVLGKNRLMRLTLAAALALLALLALAAARGAPTFAIIALTLAVGYVVAMTLVFQLSQDLPGAWTERGLGVTHAQFVGAYERLSWRLGGGTGLVAAALFIAGRALGATPWAELLGDAGKILAVTATPALVFPWIMFQIDGRRVGVNAVVVLITALFLGTAVYAHWLSLLLPIILRYYALTSQAGRFYRA